MNTEDRILNTGIKLQSFTQLNAWKFGHELVIEIYKVTKKFPKDEQFGLTNQIRRAVVSFTSNIAEGFGRNSYKEKIQFYAMSLGSLREVQNQLLIAKDVGYISVSEHKKLLERTVLLSKITTGLIKKSRSYVK